MAYLWKQGAFRGLANYEVFPQTERLPNFRVGFGLQGIGTGNPGYFATTEKTVTTDSGSWTGYLGIGYRANENHGHALGGLKFSPDDRWTLGVQHDGHDTHPFVTYRLGEPTLGLYLIKGKSPALMLSLAR